MLKGALRLGVHPIREQGGDVLELVREIRQDRVGGARHSVGGLEAESLGEDGGERAEGAEKQSVPLRARELTNGAQDRLRFGEALRESVARAGAHEPPDRSRTRTGEESDDASSGGVSVGDGVSEPPPGPGLVVPILRNGRRARRGEGRRSSDPRTINAIRAAAASEMAARPRSRTAGGSGAVGGGGPGAVRSSCANIT